MEDKSKLTRREFIKLTAKGAAATIAGASLLSIPGAVMAEASKKRRPNILYILNDHQAFYGHGAYGGPKIRRPNFDRLASQGAEFSRAYCASPLCGPSRRTMLTGLFPHNHGEIKNDVNAPYDREVYLDILAQNGYRNFYYGKWHAGAGTAKDHHCEGFSNPSYNSPYNKPEYKDYLKEHGLPDFEVKIGRSFLNSPEEAKKIRAEKPDALRGAVPGEPYHVRGEWCNPHVTGVMTSPEATHEAMFLADLACKQLEELAKSKSDQPWSMRIDFWGPHPPYFASKRFLDMYDAASIPEYPNFKDDLKTKPNRYKSEANWPLHDGQRHIIQPNPLPWSQWQKALAMCYAQISLIDHAGGIIVDMLDKLGLDKDTLVVWSTDHGDAVACHGGHFDKDAYLPEEMMRIPMAVRFPGRIKPGQKRKELVGNIDLAPTFLAAAGLSFSKETDGRSLLPLCTGETKDWRKDLMCETHGHFKNELGRMVVTDQYKYVWNDGDMDELYDLTQDHYEMKNLIDSPTHKDILEDMKARLAKWQQQSHDDPKSPESPFQKLIKGRKS
ncbi:MAG: sulfatase-like hydrolase/transferase [Armatimonadetes bacterium]|nr:sulfatase-like hydrolase/transferase [Armatimonadota bacterium]